jgi:tetratricopeptide (TPR) repeat protein
MTMTLAHPAAEDLGRFVEGTLDDAGRAAVVAHIADCDECRILVVDAAEFVEPAVEHSDRRWWVAVAAVLIIVAGIGTFTYREYRNPLSNVEEAYGQLKSRPIEARLSEFPYVPWHAMRGDSDDRDPTMSIVQGEAAGAIELRRNDARTLHARGIGFLLAGSAEESIAPLQAAATREPHNAKYQSDLAAALIAAARGDHAKLQIALAVCDRALQIDPRAPEALFNRATALEQLEKTLEAIAAYDQYLTVDPASPWASEAKGNRDRLQESLQTP